MTLQRFKISDDDGQQIVEVVRDTASKLPDTLHLLRLMQTFFARAPLGQIARDLGKTNQDPCESRIALITTFAQNWCHLCARANLQPRNLPVLAAVSMACRGTGSLGPRRYRNGKNAVR